MANSNYNNSNSVMKRSQSLTDDMIWHGKQMKTQVVLRLLAFVATLVASLLMAFNKQTSEVAGYSMRASYGSSPAFKFFLAGNAVVCAYSLMSLACVPNIVEGYLLPVLDLVSMGVVIAAASAASAISHLVKKGNDEFGWSKVCRPDFDKFCNRVALSLVSSYISFVLFLLICIISSAYKTKQITDHY